MTMEEDGDMDDVCEEFLKIIDQLYIVLDVTQNVKPFPVSIYQDHSGDEDSFQYLSSILE